MILLFPTLIEGITEKKGREAFKATDHMFYQRRVVDIRDGANKWDGMDGKSNLLDEDGNVIKKKEQVEKEVEEEKKQEEKENGGSEANKRKRKNAS